jgi:hypothetical protein
VLLERDRECLEEVGSPEEGNRVLGEFGLQLELRTPKLRLIPERKHLCSERVRKLPRRKPRIPRTRRPAGCRLQVLSRDPEFTSDTDDPVQQTIVAAGAFALTARFVLKLCRGGLGLWLLRPLWGKQWRANEYAADQYAATLNQTNELADFLETNALIYDQPVPFTWLTAHTHPPTELRIDRLQTAGHDRAMSLA